LHDKLRKAVDAKIKIEADVHARLSDLLDRGRKTAPDQSQHLSALEPTAAVRPTATDYDTMSDSQLKEKLIQASCESDIREWTRVQMLSWIEDKNLAECKRKYGTKYANWPERYLRMELGSRSDERSTTEASSVGEVAAALQRSDFTLEFCIHD
jgi:hypothetical protein